MQFNFRKQKQYNFIMHSIKKITLFLGMAFSLVSCLDEVTYADQLKAEKNLIADFIKRQNITVVEKLPNLKNWPQNVFYKTPTGLYINIVELGDTLGNAVISGDEITMRYIQYTLQAKADTMWYMNTIDNPFPRKFVFNNLASTDACKGWHEAVSIMKYNNTKARIIVYSKLGFSADEESVTPYGYDMTIRISN